MMTLKNSDSLNKISAIGETKSFTQVFDETNRNWERTPEYNLLFLKHKQNHLNDLLHVRGHLFLNDVYDQLGFDRTPAGQVVGWLVGGKSDNYIDFNITDLQKESNHPSVQLTFNVDGVIFDQI